MRWPIRNQILLPFCLLQAIVIAVVSISSAWLAVRRAEQEAMARLDRVATTLAEARFPVRDQILIQMKGLSGAEFVAAAAGDHVTASTLPRDTALQLLSAIPSQNGPGMQLGELTPLAAGSERWFAGSIELPGVPELKRLLVLIPESQWLAIRREVIGPPLLIGAISLAATVVMSWWIASRFGTRVQRVQEHVQTIATGRFDESLAVSGDDELTRLMESVNRMAGDLTALTNQIRTSERATLVTQVAGGLAHQLRNSITGAKLAIQLHLRRAPHVVPDSLAVALTELSIMENQIRGLLSLTRDVQQPLRRGRVDEIVQRVCELVTPRCQHGAVDLAVDSIDTTTPAALHVADADQLESALMNLVQNAIEACGPQGRVRVRVLVGTSEIQIAVLDTGPGVPENLGERIFEPFVTGKPEGIGLGLAQARRAAESAGGRLSVTRSDEWTEFCLSVQRLDVAR